MKKLFALSIIVIGLTASSVQAQSFARPQGTDPDYCFQTNQVVTVKDGAVLLWSYANGAATWSAVTVGNGSQPRISRNGALVSFIAGDKLQVKSLKSWAQSLSIGKTARGPVLWNGGWNPDSKKFNYIRMDASGTSYICQYNRSNSQETVIRQEDGEITGVEAMTYYWVGPTEYWIWAGNLGKLPPGNSALWQSDTLMTDGNSGRYYAPRLYPDGDIEVMIFSLDHQDNGHRYVYLMSNGGARNRKLIQVPSPDPFWPYPVPAVGAACWAGNYSVLVSNGVECFFVRVL